MNVKIVDIVEKLLGGYKVVAQLDSNEFIAEWDGDEPEKGTNYEVEIDIDDEFIWNANIAFSSEKSSAIIEKEVGVKIIGKLYYNSESNLATLNVYYGVVLIDVEGIEQDISNEWVEIHCSSIKIFNTNL